MKVKLTWAEMLHGAQIGVMRHLKNRILDRRRDGYGLDSLGWNENVHGALGELALAKALNVYWQSTTGGHNKRPDVGGYEVKTICERNHRLIVRDNDADEKMVALVYGRDDEFEIMGWIRCGDAKRVASIESHQGREPQYYVDQRHLKPFAQLQIIEAVTER